MRIIHKVLNSLPYFRGKLRLARYLLPNQKQRAKFKTKDGLFFSVPNLVENVSFELYVNGIYEKETIDYICLKMPKNGVLIDVGANIGAISIAVAKKRPDLNIFAFEASPKVFNYLRENKEQNNCLNLTIFNLAIHDIGGIELPFFSPIELNGKGSFAPVFTDEAVMVSTISLDDFFNQEELIPDLIKIDVEGYELSVLNSMKHFLNENSKCEVLFEFGDWTELAAGFEIGGAQKYLSEFGYSLYKFPDEKAIYAPLDEGAEMIIAKKVNYLQQEPK
jgi:FkbM family methyltransferase